MVEYKDLLYGLNILLGVDYIVKNYYSNKGIRRCVKYTCGKPNHQCGHKEALCSKNFFKCEDGLIEKIGNHNQALFKLYFLINIYFINNEKINKNTFLYLLFLSKKLNSFYVGKRNKVFVKILTLILITKSFEHFI